MTPRSKYNSISTFLSSEEDCCSRSPYDTAARRRKSDLTSQLTFTPIEVGPHRRHTVADLTDVTAKNLDTHRRLTSSNSHGSSSSSQSSTRSSSSSSSSDTFVENRGFIAQFIQAIAYFLFLPNQKGIKDYTFSSNSNQDETDTAGVIETVADDTGYSPSPSPIYKDNEEGYWGQNGASLGIEIDGDTAEATSMVRAITLRLEGALRAAKKAHLQTSEVLLPPDLLTRVARDILLMAETEPCGLRGCLIILNFESGGTSTTTPPAQPASTNNNSLSNNNNNNSASPNPASSELASANSRKIGTVKCDQQTVTTFELHLSLREDLAPWYSRLPAILRNLAKGGTIVVSPAYTIAKKKLYRSH